MYTDVHHTMFMLFNSNKIGVTNGGGTAYPLGAIKFTPSFLMGFMLLNL
jgi:hypothetical protein